MTGVQTCALPICNIRAQRRVLKELRADGTISGGMIPKLETCVSAVEAGCEAAVVLDGRVPHAMLLEFFTVRGAGTLISAA